MTALGAGRQEDDVLTDGGLINLAGAAVRFDHSGVLHWPEERLVVVADLHLEKGSSQGARGRFVPPYDTRKTLVALAETLDRLKPERVIALGDSFHDEGGEARLVPADLERLKALVCSVDWTWVAGNHDPLPPGGLGGTPVAEIAVGRLIFRHEPRAGLTPGEVAGHLHPAAKVGRLRSVRRRAFVSDGKRVILPAFGAYTGGLNITDIAFKGLFERSRLIAWMLSDGRVYPVRPSEFLPD